MNYPQYGAAPQAQQMPPWRHDVAQWQMLQINPLQPPFVPQNIQAVAWLRQYVPFTTGILQLAIQGVVGKGPVSMFFFNWMADNGWNNQQFAQLVQDTVDYIFIENQHYTPPPQQIEGVIQQGIAGWMSMRTIATVMQFPHLSQMINPVDAPQVQAACLAFQNYMQRISAMRAGTATNVGYGQPVGQQMPPQGWGQPPQQQQGWGQPQQAGYGQPQRPQGHVPYTTGGANYAAAGPGYGAQMNNAPDVSGGRDFGAAAPQQQHQQAQTQYQQPAQPTSTVNPPFVPRKDTPMETQAAPATPTYAPATVGHTETTWKGNSLLPYPPAFNVRTHELRLSVNPDGTTTPYVTEKDPAVIDKDRHDVASLFGMAPAGVTFERDQNKINAALIRGVQAITQDGVKAKENSTEEKPVYTTLTKPTMLGVVSMTQAWLTAQIEHMALKQKPSVYRAFARIYTPLLGWNDETETLVNFSKSYTYVELREKIKAVGGEAMPVLVAEVRQRMTDHANHILHKKMSIAPEALTVTDFVNDLDALLTMLRNDYSPEMEKAFLKDERKEIAAIFQTLDTGVEGENALIKQLTGNLLDDTPWDLMPDDNKPVATFLGTTYSLTLINALSYDLALGGVEGVGNALTESWSPALFEIAKNIFEEAADFGGDVYRHLIRTQDGRMLEVARGNLNVEMDVMTVSLVK